MAFRRVTNNVDNADETDVNQYADAFNGVGGKGQPLDLIQLDQDRYYVVIKNLNGNSKVLQGYKADGTLLVQVDGNGLRGSVDGTANAVPLAPQAGARLTGTVALSGRVLRRRASSVAAAATLALPSDGDLIPVTGTATITAITAIALTNLVDGPVVTLEFQSAGCRVRTASTLRLHGDFCSAYPGATLTLQSDGTNWNEVGRAGCATQGVLCQAAGQTLVVDAVYAQMVLAAATYDRYGMKSGNGYLVPWSGVWRAEGNLQIATGNSGNRNVAIHKNNVLHATVAHVAGATSSQNPYGASWSVPMSLVAGDTVDVRAKIDGTTNLAVQTTSWSALNYVGPL